MGTENTARIIVTADTNQAVGAFSSLEKSIGGLGGVISGVSALAPSLAGALSVGAFVAWSKSIIDAADEMNDLSQRIGIGVEQLAKYELAAKQSGTSMESVARGVKGLSAAMFEHGGALRAAGITAKDADGAMRQLADVFAHVPDGMKKTNLAVKLFGKAGMDLIPMLNMGSKGLDEAAQKSAKYAAALAALAPQADKFNDSLAELSINGKIAGMTLVNQFLPQLTNISGAMAQAAKESGMLMAIWVGLGGVMEEFKAKVPVRDIGLVNTEIETLKKNMADLGQRRGQKQGWLNDFADGTVEEQWQKSNKRYSELLKERTQLENAAAAAAAAAAAKQRGRKTDASAKDSSKEIDEWLKEYERLNKAFRDRSGTAKSAVDEFAGLMNKLNAKDVGLDASYWKDLETLHQGYLKGRIDVDEYAAAVAKLTNSQKFHTDAVKEQEEFYKELNKAQEEALAAAVKEAENLDDEVKKQRLANEEIGLTADALEQLKESRLDDAIATKEQALASAQAKGANIEELAAISHQIEALRELHGLKASGAAAQGVADAAKKAADEWKKFNEQIEQSLTDALMRGFENGDGFGKNFVQSLQNMLKTTVLKVAVQAVVQPVTGEITSMLGIPGASGGAGGMFSTGSNLLGMSGSSSGLYSSFATSSIGQSLGLSQMTGGMTQAAQTFGSLTMPATQIAGTAELTSLGSMLGSVGTAMPYVVAAAVIADALGLFGKGGGPQQGQYGTLSSSGYKSDYTMSGGDSMGNQKLAESAYAQVAALYQIAGKKTGDLVVEQGYKLDPKGSAAGVAFRNIRVDGQSVTGGTFDGNSGAQWTGAHDDAAGAASYLGKLSSAEILKVTDAIGDPAFSATVAKLATNFGDLNTALAQYSTAQAMQRTLEQSLMSDSEKLTESMNQMKAGFSSAGIAIPATAGEFRALVHGLDLATAAGQQQLATLNALAPAWLQNAQAEAAAAKALAEKKRSLDIELMKAVGDTAGATAAEHADALAALDPSLRNTQQAIWDAIAAQNAQALAADRARASQDAQTASLTAAAQAAEAARSKMEAMSASIKQAISGLIGEMPGSAQASYLSAKADVASMIDRMRHGKGLPDEAQLNATLAALKPSTAGFSTRLDYQREVMGTAGMLQALDRAVMGKSKVSTTADVVSELSKLRAENAQLRAEMASVAASSKKTADLLLRVTRDGNALVTTV